MENEIDEIIAKYKKGLSDNFKEALQEVAKNKIDEIIPKYKESLSGDFEEILREIVTEAYIQGKKERTVKVSELISTKQLAERLGVNVSRANVIIKQANEDFGVGFRLGDRDWFLLESEIELIRPKKAGKPPSASIIKLKISKKLKKIMSDKVASIVSETERNITINNLIHETLEEADITSLFSPEFKYPLVNDTSITLTLSDKGGRKISRIADFLSAKYDKEITKQDLILQVLYKKFWSEEQNNLFIDIIDNIDDR